MMVPTLPPDFRLTSQRIVRQVEPEHIRVRVASHFVKCSLSTHQSKPTTLVRGQFKNIEVHVTAMHGQTARSINLVRVQRSLEGPLTATTV